MSDETEPIGIRLWRLTPEERADSRASYIAMCPICEPLLGQGYPLWGVHLQAAITLHAAHRAVAELRMTPALTDEDRMFGRRLAIVDREPA